jgi:hypothetical protein
MSRILTFWLASIASILLVACGGSDDPLPASTAPANVVPVVVDKGPVVDGQAVGIGNVAYVSVTVCAPGAGAACQTIDHILVDTGSSGLRIVSSVLADTLRLPAAVDAGGQALTECMQFMGGNAWGSVRRADVHLGGETAAGLAVQIIGDPASAAEPAACSSSGPQANTVTQLAANGILGIGTSAHDCGAACVGSTAPGIYYACANNACNAVTVAESAQVSNPVVSFAVDNNGTVLQLPALASTGGTDVVGQLVFGIGTRPDNALGAATVQTVDPVTGSFTTVYKSRALPDSYLDSGTSAYAFADATIATCASRPDFYCPPSPLTLSATNTGLNGASVRVAFTLVDADSAEISDAATALSGLGFDSAGSDLDTGFVWGLPFFFGRSVFTAIEGATVAGVTGPWVAYR